MKTLAIVGCGKLSGIVVKALAEGLLPEYTLVGTYSRTKENSEKLCAQFNDATGSASCTSCGSIKELLALKPDYILESASPASLKEFILEALEQGTSVVALSMGAFSDKTFYEEVHKAANKGRSNVHIVSGAIGGLDVLRTVSLMGESTVSFETEKGPASLRSSPVYDATLENEGRNVFEGKAAEAIQLFPTSVNVAIAASLASVGPEQMEMSITSTPNFTGDEHRIRIQGKGVSAKIDVYSSTSEIAGWSVVSTLRSISSPIKFG